MSLSDSEVDQNAGDPVAINAENWAIAEEATQQVLDGVHPTIHSEMKRREIIDYFTRLFNILQCKVFPYGSFPLKTYLPHGDIDFTLIRSPNVEGSLADDVLALLKREEESENAEYEVKGTKLTPAKVKIVECIVEGIEVDISFNHSGGLLALCFLEQVDCLVGKNHLFKRSIILIKAWIYYERCILGGARSGSISTYALETLVLYIFHLFHSSLNSPLEVLYGFLKYFSQFDWNTYCVSLQGPVCISSLPDIVVEMPENGQNNCMLSEEFLKHWKELFSNSSRSVVTKPKEFQKMHLNILDPLAEYDNLGRSVNTGNFKRICSAFKDGAETLDQVLLQPRDKVAEEVRGFFKNIPAWHGHLALAELIGNNENHIRCLRYAQQIQGFAFSSHSDTVQFGAMPKDSEGTTQSARRNTSFFDMIRRNELTPTLRGSSSSTNITREVMNSQSRIQGRRSQARSLSSRSVGNDNHANDSSSSDTVQFGVMPKDLV